MDGGSAEIAGANFCRPIAVIQLITFKFLLSISAFSQKSLFDSE
jgi:hypothetical protein